MQSNAKTVEEYISSLTAERAEAIKKVREVILKNLPPGYEENMNWGMISYEIPLSKFSDTYNKQPLGIVALASQKQHMSVYLMSIYADPKMEKWFTDEYKKSGKRMDIGKSCVRFRKLENLPLDLIGKAIAKSPSPDDYISFYKKSRGLRK
ncbi:MAG: DUF1801 domain-containing protein [Candidatus Woykebacteria bacterium]